VKRDGAGGRPWTMQAKRVDIVSIKEEKVKELYSKLTEGVQNVIQSGKLAELMKFWSRFRKYSFNNTLMIFFQKPDATLCAGYKTWEKCGRKVKKGEKGIAIFAPRTYRQEVEDEETGENYLVTRLAGFRVVHVFDITQTDGKPLPGEETRLGDTLAGQELYKRLVKVAADVKVNLVEGDTGRSKGHYSHGKNMIVISSYLEGDEKAAVLLHELAHAMAFRLGEQRQAKSKKETEYIRGEVIAEGAAYMAASYFGLDTGDCAFDYVAGWSGDVEKVLAWGDAVQKVAGELISLVEKVQSGKEAA